MAPENNIRLDVNPRFLKFQLIQTLRSRSRETWNNVVFGVCTLLLSTKAPSAPQRKYKYFTKVLKASWTVNNCSVSGFAWENSCAVTFGSVHSCWFEGRGLVHGRFVLLPFQYLCDLFPPPWATVKLEFPLFPKENLYIHINPIYINNIYTDIHK